jgi:soluble lytic murein transglycosylase-like protein
MRREVLLLLSGFSFFTPPSAVGLLAAATIERQPVRDPYGEYIAEAARRFALPTAWIRAVLNVESNGDRRATSPKGAMGLMQIMPDTWTELRVRYGLGADPYDPHDNIMAGSAYIRYLYDRYGSPGWIAAYNAGPGRYEAYLNGRSLPPETRAYVATVASNLDRGDALGGAMITTVNPHPWTRAALFVAQSDRRPDVDSTPSESSPNDTRPTTIVRDVSALVPQSGGLFVARAAVGTVR